MDIKDKTSFSTVVFFLIIFFSWSYQTFSAHVVEIKLRPMINVANYNYNIYKVEWN